MDPLNTLNLPPMQILKPSDSSPKKSKPQIHKCLVCDKTYSKKTSLLTHHKLHPEHCVYCGKNRGSSVQEIYTHNILHKDQRAFICQLCGESFLRNQQFIEHTKLHDKPPPVPEPPKDVVKESKYKCKICNEAFSNLKQFYKHQTAAGHHNEKFLCEVCGNEFHSKFLMNQHMRRTHMKKGVDESLNCHLCEKNFEKKYNLELHIKRVHSKVESQSCNICFAEFSSGNNLNQHIKQAHMDASNTSSLECQICHRQFKAKNQLTRHEKQVHSHDRMFKCDVCPDKFKRTWHLTRHNQMMHIDKNHTALPETTNMSMGSSIGSLVSNGEPAMKQEYSGTSSTSSWDNNSMQNNNYVSNMIGNQMQETNCFQNDASNHLDLKPLEPVQSSSGGYQQTLHYAVNEYSNKFDMLAVNVSNPNSSNATPMLPDPYNYNNQWDNNYSTNSQANRSVDIYQNNGWYYNNEIGQLEQEEQQTQQNQIYQNFNYQKTDYSCLNQNQDPSYQHSSYNYHPNFSNPIQDNTTQIIQQSTIRMGENYLINPINSLNQIKMEENYSSDLNGLNLNPLNNSLSLLGNGNNSNYGPEDLNWNG